MFNSLFDGAPVDIMQMLDARERRAHTQQQLLEQFKPCVLVSITLNIPGPVKNSEAITTVFASVISELDEALQSFEKLQQEDFSLATGMEFYRVLRADASTLVRSVKKDTRSDDYWISMSWKWPERHQLQFPEQPLECLQDVVLSAMRKQKCAPVLESTRS